MRMDMESALGRRPLDLDGLPLWLCVDRGVRAQRSCSCAADTRTGARSLGRHYGLKSAVAGWKYCMAASLFTRSCRRIRPGAAVDEPSIGDLGHPHSVLLRGDAGRPIHPPSGQGPRMPQRTFTAGPPWRSRRPWQAPPRSFGRGPAGELKDEGEGETGDQE
jgi:hypothetical protein